MELPQEIVALIDSGCPAHLVTLNPDGSPQVSLIWIGMEGGQLGLCFQAISHGESGFSFLGKPCGVNRHRLTQV